MIYLSIVMNDYQNVLYIKTFISDIVSLNL
jgi:hypothetical protein